ncbi:phage tail tape measure protein [Leeuwenhoekiella marinoflava]|uniref:TP901 family phage tail tape measure protein n=2 Tax=Leeuwenhoekiella marinoflava TaxID=988 RepID=A0A4Q0PMV9_9FLAO|nr:phage tail tape measure protein [Leeuwenhoekiella marinoflava]RXG31807.1 TP901 family phage tail tape measure protein [Leeuwenhoekiella marinoflava]SHF04419.1 phage tail tape measure protein, TP901 family, core region [Leeuwenhoekiella marinoflava DSM 3653]
MAVRGSNSLFFASGINNDGLKQGAREAEGIIGGLASTVSRINPFAGLLLGAATAFTAIANDSFQLAKDFEKAMKEVETISKATQDNFDDISSKVFNLSKISPDGPVELAKAYYQIVSAGYDGAEGLKLLETAAKAATAGVTTTETAADGITTVLNAFKLGAEDAEDVADALFQTVKLGKTNFEQLSSSLSQVAPLAAASGFEFREVLAAVASLTKQGVPTAQAMTQIRAAIEATTKVLGDGASESLTLQNAFQAVYNEAGGSQNKLKELTGSVEAMGAILSTTGENAKGAAQDLEDLGNSAGASQEAFERNISSNVNQLGLLGNRIKAITRGIGESALDVSNELAKFLNRAIADTENYNDAIRKQANEFNILQSSILDTNTTYAEKIELIQKLEDQYPEYLQSIDLDKIKNDDLETTLQKVKQALSDINDEQNRRLKLSGLNQKVIDAQNNKATQKGLYEQSVSEFYKLVEEIKTYAAEEDIKLNFSYSDSPTEILGKLNKQLDANPFGKGGRLIADLNFANDAINLYSRGLREANNELDKEEDELQRIKRLTYDNAEGFKQIAKEVAAINSLEALKPFEKYQFPDTKNLVDARKEILETLESIDLAKDIPSLKPFLESEIDEVRNYALKRQRLLNTDYTPKGGSGGDSKKDAFTEMLNKNKEEYEKYEAVVKQIGKEIADAQFETLLKQGSDYGEFLKNQLDKTKVFAEQQKIALSAEKEGINLNRGIVTSPNSLQPITVPVDFEIDITSINAIDRQLRTLYEKFYAAQTDEERKALAERIKIRRLELEEAEKYLNDVENLNGDFQDKLFDMNNRELRAHIKKLKTKLKSEELTKDQIIAYNEEISRSQEELGNNIQQTGNEIAGILGQVSSLFSKFGDEDTAKLVDQLAGVAAGAGQLGKGIATGNVVDIVSGGLKVLDSALTVEVVSDTAKFEAAIKSLNSAIDDLDYVISKSVGRDQITSRLDQLKNLEQLQEDIKRAERAEKEAEKQVKLLGLTVGKKGKGSGTDAAKLEEFAEQAKQLKREAQELQAELNEIYTGTSSQSITDSIIEGFRNGKRAASDFADDFGVMMQEALLNNFKINFLANQVEDFYKEFAEAGSDGSYSSADIERLRNFYNTLITGAQTDLDAINDILENTGIGSLGADTSKQGLSGAIASVTEDTANILAGTLNAVRLDQRQMLTVNQQANIYLAEISVNTRYNRYLESIDGRFASIESAILQFQAGG